jgi:hypothetical protein
VRSEATPVSALIPLVVLWLVVLVPSAVRSRVERRREFIGSFSAQLGALEASSASSVAVDTAAIDRSSARRTPAQRRRAIVVGLLLSMVVTALPLLVFPGKLALAVHLAVDDGVLFYLALLVRWREARAELSATGTRVLPTTPVAAGGDPNPAGLAAIA